MRKILFLSFLIFVIVSISFPFHVQAKNLTYASDYYVYGNDLVNKRQYEDALLAYQTARSMDERFYNEHYGITYQIGWVLNKLGRYDEALKEFQIAKNTGLNGLRHLQIITMKALFLPDLEEMKKHFTPLIRHYCIRVPTGMFYSIKELSSQGWEDTRKP